MENKEKIKKEESGITYRDVCHIGITIDAKKGSAAIEKISKLWEEIGIITYRVSGLYEFAPYEDPRYALSPNDPQFPSVEEALYPLIENARTRSFVCSQ